jgi:hypothetical protein
VRRRSRSSRAPWTRAGQGPSPSRRRTSWSPTPSNTVATRLTAGRSILGTTSIAADRDVPPGSFITVGTPGVLPFFATLQRQVPGTFTADVSLSYTEAELLRAGIPAGSANEAALVVAKFVPGACAMGAAACSENGDCGANGPCNGATYTVLPTTIDTTNHVATAPTTSFSTFAVMHPNVIAGGRRRATRPRRRQRTHRLPRRVGAGERDERAVPSPRLVNSNQACADGDPNCDADRTADGTCTFQVAICLNQTDPSLAACTPTTTASVHVKLGRKPNDVAAADAVLNALVALGGTRTGAKLDDVDFSPALSGERVHAVRVHRGAGPADGSASGCAPCRPPARRTATASA